MERTEGKFVTLSAADGMWLTDGESWSEKVYVPLGGDEGAWREATAEEKAAAEAELKQAAEAKVAEMKAAVKAKLSAQ